MQKSGFRSFCKPCGLLRDRAYKLTPPASWKQVVACLRAGSFAALPGLKAPLDFVPPPGMAWQPPLAQGDAAAEVDLAAEVGLAAGGASVAEPAQGDGAVDAHDIDALQANAFVAAPQAGVAESGQLPRTELTPSAQ